MSHQPLRFMSDSQEVFYSLRLALLSVAAIPFFYYALALVSSLRFFWGSRKGSASGPEPSGPEPYRGKPSSGEASGDEPRLDWPPVSILKPVRGLDPEAYENFASFCRLDYPDYEVLFCVGDTDDPALPVLERLTRDFAQTRIRILIGSASNAAERASNDKASNDKCAKLARLTDEAAYEHLAISDSDVRAEADYLRRVIAPLADPKVGAVTPLYVPLACTNWTQHLQEAGMLLDFYPGLFVAKDLDGVKFALGPTIATRRSYLLEFGGYAAIENRPADDLLIGRLVAEHGREVVLLPYAIATVPDFQSFRELWSKRLRWMTVMRHMRPAGHLGLIFTLGLPWVLLAMALAPHASIAECFLGGYLMLRFTLLWLVGRMGLRQTGLWREILLVPAWDALATLIWLTSFMRRTIRWRGCDYAIVNGQLTLMDEEEGIAPEGAQRLG